MGHAAPSELEAGRVTRSARDAHAPTETVRVWDLFVRIFHWSLVVLFAIGFATSDTSESLHIAAGYGVLGLITMRIFWGFVGSRHARFSDFIFRPKTVLGYLKDAPRFRAKRYLGHNPAGGAMVFALLAALLVVTGSGVMMTMDAFWGRKWIEDVHETAAYATLALVTLHVAGVIFSSLEHHENLVKSMLTGRKPALRPVKGGEEAN